MLMLIESISRATSNLGKDFQDILRAIDHAENNRTLVIKSIKEYNRIFEEHLNVVDTTLAIRELDEFELGNVGYRLHEDIKDCELVLRNLMEFDKYIGGNALVVRATKRGIRNEIDKMERVLHKARFIQKKYKL